MTWAQEVAGKIDELERLSPSDLYARFHQLQFEVLDPQWQSHLAKILGTFDRRQILEVFAPRQPSPPEGFSAELKILVADRRDRETVVFHHALSYADDPQQVLQIARAAGFKKAVIHQSPPRTVRPERDWTIASETSLDFIYATPGQKLVRLQMELALERLQEIFAGKPSRFEAMRPEWEAWLADPAAQKIERGLSQWLVMEPHSNG